MKKIVLLLIIMPTLCCGQLRTDQTRKCSQHIPKQYELNASRLCEQIFAQIPLSFKKDSMHVLMSYQFANETAYGVANYVYSNAIYADWKEMEDYINDVMLQVMPPELKDDSLVYCYITKNGSVNAFSTGAGKIFINIGLLAEMPDEATLAYIILHELAHYYLKHQLKTDLAIRTGKFDMGLLGDNDDKLEFRYSVKEEYSCDSLAILWIGKSGYNVAGGINANKIEERMVQNGFYKGTNNYPNDWKTRQLAREKNIDLLNRMDKNGTTGGEFYLVSKDKFAKLKGEAKPEILKCLMSGMRYNDCIERSFKFHLLNPNNGTFINYLMESVRRKCYCDKKDWKELFITNRYEDTVDSKGFCSKRKIKYNLFKYFDPIILNLSEKEANDMVAKFYWNGEPKFSTNEQAFEYFYTVSRSYKDCECNLSAALSYPDDKENRDIFLKKYVSCSIANLEFVQKLMQDSVCQSLPNIKLYVFDNFHSTIRLGQDDIKLLSYNSDSTSAYSNLCNQFKNSGNGMNSICLPLMKQTNQQDYLLFKELELLSLQYPQFTELKTNLYTLDPKFYELFRRYGINEICFISFSYFENRKAEKTLSSYRNAANEDYKKLLDKDFGTRNLDILISNVRMQNKLEIHSFRLYNKHEFSNNANGVKEIISLLNSDLLEFAKQTKKIDDLYLVVP